MMTINLLRSSSQRCLNRRRQCQITLLSAAAAALALCLALAALIQSQIKRQQEHHAVLQRALDALSAPQRARAALAAASAQWQQRAALAGQVEATAIPWARLLTDLSAHRSSEVRLTGVRQSGRSLRVTGEARGQDDVQQYQQRLGALDWVAASSLVEMRGARISGTVEGERQPVKTFELRLTLSPVTPRVASGQAVP